ncbi:MFS transporter [Kitasatospora terrestris]|uniref:MFS transporter n=1 Tax=Kitasatospora terrestris TaxID=258051 RepID=UPI0031F1A457
MRLALPSVLRDEPLFARLFFGQSLSVLGDRVTFVVLPFAVLSVGGSAADVGWVTAAGLVPLLLLVPVGGVWADRLPRHRVMLVADAARFAVQAAAAALLLAGRCGVGELVALMAVSGAATAFFTPASSGLLPLLVPTERLREANALRGVVMSGSVVVGPAVAGGLIAAVGPGGALAFDAVSFAVSAVFLARLGVARPADRPAEREPFLRELREGWDEVRSRPWVWAGMAGMSMYHVVVLPAVFVLGPVLADREWGGANSWALVTAAFGVGALAGDLWLYRLRPDRPMVVAAAALAVASCQAVVIGCGGPVVLIAVLEAVTGVAVSVFFVLWETALQTHIPERSLSRVSSFDHLLSAGLMPLGLALAGPLTEVVGVRTGLVAMSAVAVPCALALLGLRSVRTLPAEPEKPAETEAVAEEAAATG